MNVPSIRSTFSRLHDVDAFGVGATSAQLTWRNAAPGATLGIAGRTFELDRPAGALTVDALQPDTEYSVEFTSGSDTSTLPFRTMPDAGPVRSKFATISDIHLGLDGFGVGKRIKSGTNPPHPLPCAIAAVEAAQEWGAEVLLIKGDLTESGWIEEWELARSLFRAIDIPFVLTGGNHDGFERAEVEPVDGMKIAGADYAPVQTVDLAGIRLILAETSIRRKGNGRISPVADELVAAATVDTPVFIGIHHNLQQLPLPWFWPPGISSTDAAPVLERLRRANPNIFMSSGHTHRNRRLDFDNIVFTEVASTSDYPGVWAGYEVTDTVIRQTVHRIATDQAIEWSEKATKAVGGVWPRWSQGRLEDRSVDLHLRSR